MRRSSEISGVTRSTSRWPGVSAMTTSLTLDQFAIVVVLQRRNALTADWLISAACRLPPWCRFSTASPAFQDSPARARPAVKPGRDCRRAQTGTARRGPTVAEKGLASADTNMRPVLAGQHCTSTFAGARGVLVGTLAPLTVSAMPATTALILISVLATSLICGVLGMAGGMILMAALVLTLGVGAMVLRRRAGYGKRLAGLVSARPHPLVRVAALSARQRGSPASFGGLRSSPARR